MCAFGQALLYKIPAFKILCTVSSCPRLLPYFKLVNPFCANLAYKKILTEGVKTATYNVVLKHYITSLFKRKAHEKQEM